MTVQKLPFLFSILSSACLFCSLLSSSYAYQFNVGGKYGWVANPSENYNHWTGRMRFQVNDTLFFNYRKSDSVLLVSKEDYEKCNTKKPIMKMEDGNSIFKFDRSGPFYFISGTQQNCQKGQKMITVVLAVRNNNISPPKAPSPSGQPPPVVPPPNGNMPSSPSPSETTVSPTPANAPTPSFFPISPSPYPGTGGPGTDSPTPGPSTNVPGANSPTPGLAPGPATNGHGGDSPSPSPDTNGVGVDSPTPSPDTNGPGTGSPTPGPGADEASSPSPASTTTTPPNSSATPGSPEESTAPSPPGSSAADADSPGGAPPKNEAVSAFNPIFIMLVTTASVVLSSVLV